MHSNEQFGTSTLIANLGGDDRVGKRELVVSSNNDLGSEYLHDGLGAGLVYIVWDLL